MGSERAEECDDVAPGSHERSRPPVPIAPRVPVAVHLMTEAQDYRVLISTDSLGIRAQVAIVPTGSDGGDIDSIRIHLYERHRTVIRCGIGEANRERHEPSAIVHNNVWS